jgi:hypothetical protein
MIIKMKLVIFKNLVPKETYHHFCHILLVSQAISDTSGGNYTRAGIAGGTKKDWLLK